MSDRLVHRLRPAAAEPAGALVLIHGRGADEHDLAPLLEELDPDRRLVGVLPRGPLALPQGGAHWYVVSRVGYPDAATFAAGFERLGDFVDGLPDALGVPWDRIVLGGFSQGAVMALALGLGRGRPAPAAIVALSGFVPTVDGWEADVAGRQTLPIAIAHGTLDPVIPVEFGHAARNLVRAGGIEPLYYESSIGHTIDSAAIPAIRDFVREATASK